MTIPLSSRDAPGRLAHGWRQERRCAESCMPPGRERGETEASGLIVRRWHSRHVLAAEKRR
eukprot:5929345-Pleurochrysis_carterae.AAC.2